MKQYTLSGAAADTHVPDHPERTARRTHTGLLDFDVTFQVWPPRSAMLKTIQMQERSEPRSDHWRACQQ
jgi:hypothetical protein